MLRKTCRTRSNLPMKLFGYKLVVDLNYSVVTQIVSVALAVQLVCAGVLLSATMAEAIGALGLTAGVRGARRAASGHGRRRCTTPGRLGSGRWAPGLWERCTSSSRSLSSGSCLR